METKRCNKCGELKELSAFGKNKATKDGLHHYCKECMNKYRKKYRKDNPDKLKEIQKRYYKNNPDKIKETQKKYHEENKENIKDYQKKYQKKYQNSLLDGYVKKALRLQGLPEEYITPEIIEFKRNLMELNRKMRKRVSEVTATS